MCRAFSALALCVLLVPACTGGAPAGPVATPGPAVDQDQQHPPLPADSPAWAWDAGGFVPSPGWYGEHGWDDVRMRVAGHLFVAGRDQARVALARGQPAEAAARWRELHATLLDLPEPAAPGVARQILALLREDAARQAALVTALADANVAAVAALASQDRGVSAARATFLALALEHRSGAPVDQLAPRAKALQASLLPLLAPRPDLDLDAFIDFDDRHQLRVRLFEAALDSADPLGPGDPWGYWEAGELPRAALVLGLAAAGLGGEDWSDRARAGLEGDVDAALAALGEDPLWWPSTLGRHLARRGLRADFTVSGLGALPTGDSLIDVAGEPGPRAIGSLERLGLGDPAQRAWLAEQERALDAALAGDPAAVPAIVGAMVEQLDAYGHGSRYYNIKQVRNEAVRQLARAGQPALARQVLGTSWPLHNQDWACPNRQGILLTLDGRLLLAAGQLDQAELRLAEALASGRDFLRLVDQAEAGLLTQPQPPRSGEGAPPPAGSPAGSPG